MQNQPKLPYAYSDVPLNESFPFTVSALYEQGDKVITRLHFHNAPELGVCLEGVGVFIVEGKILPFKKGDIIFIGRDERHLAQSASGTVSKWRWLYFDAERLLCPAFMNAPLADLSNFSGPQFKNLIASEEHPSLCASAHALLEIWQSKGPFFKERIVAQLALFATELHRSFPASGAGGERGLAFNPEPDAMQRLNRALEEIIRKHGGRVSMCQLAESCGLSQTHFRRLFHRAFGRSPRKYLNQMRIAMSMAELSRSRRPVSEIALACGFETLSSFNRQFKAQTGFSPRQWRGRSSSAAGVAI